MFTSAVILFVVNRNPIDKSNGRGVVCGSFPGDINAVARRGIVVHDGAYRSRTFPFLIVRQQFEVSLPLVEDSGELLPLLLMSFSIFFRPFSVSQTCIYVV